MTSICCGGRLLVDGDDDGVDNDGGDNDGGDNDGGDGDDGGW